MRGVVLVAALLGACSSTTNVTNVSVVAADAGTSDAGVADPVVADAGELADAGADGDASEEAGIPAPDPFSVGSPFQPGGSPSQTSVGKHTNNSSNAGTACLSCHRAGGLATTTFTFAGTVYEASGALPVGEGVEVRIANADLTSVQVIYTDAAGNFWEYGTFLPDGGAAVGVRDATFARHQATLVTNGDCNGCHTVGARIRLF
jgi:hypothetical protein